MGKIRRKRSRGVRYDPITASSHNGLDQSGQTLEGSVNGDELQKFGKKIPRNVSGLNSVKEKITSLEPGERITGLNILASLALEAEVCQLIVDQRVVSLVAPLMLDKIIQIRLAAAGALRNLSAGGSKDVIDEMISQDVLVPLIQLVKEYRNNQPSPNCNGSLKDDISVESEDSYFRSSVFIQAIHLLWNLCECNADAVKKFNREGLVHILLEHINPRDWGYPTSIAVADCLLCVTEDNPQAVSVVLHTVDNLVSLLSCDNTADETSWLHFVVTLIGILINVNYSSADRAAFPTMFSILSSVLDFDVPSYLKVGAQSKEQRATELEKAEHLICAQQLTFEILSNFCCSDDDEWDTAEAANYSDEEMCDEEVSPLNGGGASNELSAAVPEVSEALRHYKVADKVLSKILSYPQAAMQCNPPLSKKLSHLLYSSLVCFESLVTCLDLPDLGGKSVLLSTWQSLGNMAFGNATADSELLEACCGAMRAIVDKLILEKGDMRSIRITKEEIKVISSSCKSCSVPSVRANSCRMLGNLATLLLRGGRETYALVSDITEFLVEVSLTDPLLWVSSEAIDSLVDVYSDDDTDSLAVQVNLVQSLKQIQTNFKTRVSFQRRECEYNRERKKLGEQKAVIMTVRDNLSAFIKYKSLRSRNRKSKASTDVTMRSA